MKRNECLQTLAKLVDDSDLVVTALGGTSAEWNAVHPSDGNLFNSAMGSNLPLALGLSLALPHRRILLLDSDGCLLMTLGALCTLGNECPVNLRVFVFDNQSYLATGGQSTATAGKADLAEIARAAGIDVARKVGNLEQFQAASSEALTSERMSFVVAKVDAERVPAAPIGDHLENKYRFVRHIEATEHVAILGD